jgi:hypothetical protein
MTSPEIAALTDPLERVLDAPSEFVRAVARGGTLWNVENAPWLGADEHESAARVWIGSPGIAACGHMIRS